MHQHKKFPLILIFTIGVIARLVVYLLLDYHKEPQFWEYHTMAMNLLAGKSLSCRALGITYYAIAEPFYPMLSSIFYLILGNKYFIFAMFHILISSSISIIVFHLGRYIFNTKVGHLSALFVALHPGLIYYSTQFHPLTFNSFFFCILLYLLLKVADSLGTKKVFFIGILIGLAILDRSIEFIFLPLSTLLIILTNFPLRKKIGSIIIILFTTMLVLMPWGIRNYRIFKKVILTRSSTGFLFWLGNNPNATGSAMFNKHMTMDETLDRKAVDKLKKLNEIEQNNYFLTTALSYIKQHPFTFIKMWVKKFYYFWWFGPHTGLLYPTKWLIFYKIYYGLVLLFALLGIFRIYLESNIIKARVNLGHLNFILLTCLVLSLTQSLFYVEGRHRWVVEPIILIFTSVFITYYGLQQK